MQFLLFDSFLVLLILEVAHKCIIPFPFYLLLNARKYLPTLCGRASHCTQLVVWQFLFWSEFCHLLKSNGLCFWPSESSQDPVSVKKLEFLCPFEIMFCFVSAELKMKRWLTTPGNVLPNQNQMLTTLAKKSWKNQF